MIFRQYLHSDPVGTSYLLGCGGHHACVVVDPVEEIDPYLQTSAETGMRIHYVIDTHVHADHVSGGRRLAERAGADYLLHASAGVEGISTLVDGQQLTLGNVTLTVLHTPGHTPEHICLLVTDRTRGDSAWLILTGHTLMVGDMGRTELATTAGEGAAMLYQSAERLRELPDYVEVWPGAFAGSACGRGLSGKPSSTIGFERQFNRAFCLSDRAEFVTLMLSNIPPAPPRATAIRAQNLGASVAVGEGQ
jgi:hydroxyacylglutathione hydrolase